MNPPRLLIPGPVDVEEDVLAVLGAPVVPHYGATWGAMYVELLAMLRTIFRTSGAAYAIPGSGTTALDMMMGNALRRGDRVIVCENGYSGGFGPFQGRVLRIGHMGKAVSDEYVDAALHALGEIFDR